MITGNCLGGKRTCKGHVLHEKASTMAEKFTVVEMFCNQQYYSQNNYL